MDAGRSESETLRGLWWIWADEGAVWLRTGGGWGGARVGTWDRHAALIEIYVLLRRKLPGASRQGPRLS